MSILADLVLCIGKSSKDGVRFMTSNKKRVIHVHLDQLQKQRRRQRHANGLFAVVLCLVVGRGLDDPKSPLRPFVAR